MSGCDQRTKDFKTLDEMLKSRLHIIKEKSLELLQNQEKDSESIPFLEMLSKSGEPITNITIPKVPKGIYPRIEIYSVGLSLLDPDIPEISLVFPLDFAQEAFSIYERYKVRAMMEGSTVLTEYTTTEMSRLNGMIYCLEDLEKEFFHLEQQKAVDLGLLEQNLKVTLIQFNDHYLEELEGRKCPCCKDIFHGGYSVCEDCGIFYYCSGDCKSKHKQEHSITCQIIRANFQRNAEEID